jgi:sulfur carrier protein ThiS adenylyltransferase
MRLSEIKNHLSKFRVGIAGAGGLGSNCAAALARSGIGTLVICDFDIVEEENLSRQYYFTGQEGMMKTNALRDNLKTINPSTIVKVHQKKIIEADIPVIFGDCHIIVEAFDEAQMKEMMIKEVQKSLPGIPLIVGSGLAGWGKSNEIKCRRIDDSLYVCGDESTETDENTPPLAPRVGMVANMQANVVLEILMKMS